MEMMTVVCTLLVIAAAGAYLVASHRQRHPENHPRRRKDD